MESKVIPNDVLFETAGGFIAEGKSVLFIPEGRSMLPFIRGGRDSVVLTRPSAPLEVGDIVLARAGGRYVVHRIRAVEGDEVTLMGDGNLRGKEKCTTGDVIGIVTEIVKPGGRRVKPGKGFLWRKLLPARRLLLAVLKRTVFIEDYRNP